MMRCLYETLGVVKDADDATIRKAYRKGALAWHPDKNQDNPEEADTRFKEIQNAWEVLSDPREKAWYDNHRDQILQAGRHQAGADSGHGTQQAPPEDLSLFQYFSSSCYNGYHDEAAGFFGVYGKVFRDLGAQEASALKEGGKRTQVAPGFGRADWPWSKVSAFYQYWLHFVSDRSFVWADVHNLAAAPNRKVRRLMEEDNSKRRRAARREFQDNVRALVAFVRKRDIRVDAWVEEEERKKAERAVLDMRRREREGAERLRRAQEYQEPEWVRSEEDDGCSSADGAALIEDELYCVACDKFFKSENAMANHNRSKKHVQNAEMLQAALAEEEPESKEPALVANGNAPDTGPSPVSDAASAEAAELCSAHTGETSEASSMDECVQTKEEAAVARPASSVSRQDASPKVFGYKSASDAEGSDSSDECLDEDEMLSRMVHAQIQVGSGHSKAQKRPTVSARRSDESLPASRAAQTALSSQDLSAPAGSAPGRHSEHGQTVHEEKGETEAIEAPSHGSAASKHNEVTEPAGEADFGISHRKVASKKRRSRTSGKKAVAHTLEDGTLSCRVCNSVFESRNVLFKHIEEQGHATVPAACMTNKV